MDLTLDQARQIGIEGYVFLYPLLTMELTRRQATNGPAGVQLYVPRPAVLSGEWNPPVVRRTS